MLYALKSKFLLRLLLRKSKNVRPSKNNIDSNSGFTLLEVLITVAIIGILFGISATSWTAFLNEQRINQANQRIFSVLQETKTKARKQNQSYTLFFRDNSGTLQYAISLTKKDSNGVLIPPSNNIEWQNLSENKNDSVQLAFYSPKSTNINELKTQTFTYQGIPEDPNLDVNKRIIVNPVDGSSPRKCIIIQDLLGTLRNESDSVNKNAPKNTENFPCTTEEDEQGNIQDISNKIQVLN